MPISLPFLGRPADRSSHGRTRVCGDNGPARRHLERSAGCRSDTPPPFHKAGTAATRANLRVAPLRTWRGDSGAFTKGRSVVRMVPNRVSIVIPFPAMRNHTSDWRFMEIHTANGFTVLLDDDDANRVSNFRLNVYRTTKSPHSPYARVLWREEGKVRSVQLQRLIMNCPLEMVVDHIDGNTLDNLKSNLRIVTRAQNRRNNAVSKTSKSGVKGVYRECGGKWVAQIQVDNRKIHLGYFVEIHDAINAYNQASVEYHGKFGRLATTAD